MLLRARLRLAMAVTLSVSLACSSLSLQLGGKPAPATGRAVAAVALRLDGGRSWLGSFVGQGTDTWALPPGTYLISALDEGGTTLLLPSTVVGEAPLAWPVDFAAAGGTQDPVQQVTVEILVDFLMVSESTKLSALDHMSAGFTQPLFTTRPGEAELQDLLNREGDILTRQSNVMAAIDTLSIAAPAAATAPRLARPAADWKETLFGFFGFAGNAGARAAERIQKISSLMNAEDKADAFDSVRGALKGDAQNFDQLLERLRSGALNNQAAQIESDMRNAPGFIAAAQDSNLTTAQVVHQEGGQLVSKGAEMEAWVVKSTLNRAFPGITAGWDAADKAIKWSGYAQTAYGKGLAAGLKEMTVEQAKDKLKERLLGALGDCCADVSDSVADEITDDLAEKLAGEIVGRAQAGLSAATQADPVPDPVPEESPSATGLATLDLRDAQTVNADCDEKDFCFYTVRGTVEYKTPIVPAQIQCWITGVTYSFSDVVPVEAGEGSVTVTTTESKPSKIPTHDAAPFFGCSLDAEGIRLDVSAMNPHAEQEVGGTGAP